MAALHFEFVSPESVLFSGDVDQVDLPGSEGDMGILPGHAPLVTTLRPGIVTIFRGGQREPVVVIGGFAEVEPGRADRARRQSRGARRFRHGDARRPRSKTPRKTSPTARTTRCATSSRAISSN